VTRFAQVCTSPSFQLSTSTSLSAGQANFTSFQSAARTAFFRHLSLTGFAPVREGHSAAALFASGFRVLLVAAALFFVRIHFILKADARSLSSGKSLPCSRPNAIRSGRYRLSSSSFMGGNRPSRVRSHQRPSLLLIPRVLKW